MNRVLPLALLIIGASLAASFGARNGDAHTDYRAALWEAGGDPSHPAVVASPLPGPQARVLGWLSAGGIGWGVGVVLIGVGATLARRQQAAASRGVGGDIAIVDFEATVNQVLAELDAIGETIADLPMDDTAPAVRERIDALMDDVIQPLVEGRGQLVARNGLESFAEYFGLFSGGERNLGRVWSALTDGHAEVAREALDISRAGFSDSLDVYRAAQTQG
ncbi:MAG: hypothetical protein ACI8PZ_004172 [Myxococcota bacterium]